MICCPAGTLKIIESVELSSISRFSHYTRTTSKCPSPGSLLGHFSGPPGIKNVPCTCYNTFPKSCLSQSGPRASKGSRSFKKWSPKGDPKSWKNRFWPLCLSRGHPLDHLCFSPRPRWPQIDTKCHQKGTQNMINTVENVSQTIESKQWQLDLQFLKIVGKVYKSVWKKMR